MRKIVLRNLPPEIQLSIKRKALNEDLSREDAVVEKRKSNAWWNTMLPS